MSDAINSKRRPLVIFGTHKEKRFQLILNFLSTFFFFFFESASDSNAFQM